MRVFLHTRPAGTMKWTNSGESFDQIPRVGEYVARTSDASWARVDLVVWLPKSADTDYDVEVYAVEVDHMRAMNRAFGESNASIERGEH